MKTFHIPFLWVAGLALALACCGKPAGKEAEENNKNPASNVDTAPQVDTTPQKPANPPVSIDTALQEGFQRIYFQASSEVIRNPERGFYSHLEWDNATGSPMSSATLQGLKNQNISLAFNVYYLMDYVAKPLDAPLLTLVENNMKALRANGLKTILRFAYSRSESAAVYDAPIDVVLGHLQQLKPLMREYVDVIAAMEAGFVGVWGEWYYTHHYGSGAFINVELRRRLVDSLLSALPPERMVCLRTPGYKLKLLNISYADTLTKSEAYTMSKKARLAYHNDCFLATSSDMGTFSSEAERAYNQADSRYVVMGGETCAPSEYSGCINALLQMRDYHWSYLNKDYHQSVVGSWMSQGCLDEVKAKLGYRFELRYIDRQAAVKKGEDYKTKALIYNSGFAAPYNPRDVYLLLLTSSGNEVQRAKLTVDPRFWMSNTYQLIDMSLPIPGSLSSGSYKVALYLPDPKPTIANNPDYAIRLANHDVWDAEKGYNVLFTINVP
ncbi:MAG: DUF4832 domain-containing protein [Prevotellaceae bacterium]|jgi:hypothetical protein|nr:DUF4832 domain-containing protein [Prevotellaceae bacterium]